MLYKLRYKIVDIMREASQAGHTAGIRGDKAEVNFMLQRLYAEAFLH